MGKTQNFGWIEACLRYTGSFGKREKTAYRDVFQVSEPTLSRDQESFVVALNEACDDIIVEVRRGRISLLGGKDLPWIPIFKLPTMTRLLEDVLGNDFEKVHGVVRIEPPPHILRACVTGIKERQIVNIRYVSRSGTTSDKEVSMHALVEVAGRYHVRGYDHSKNRFADFVLSRMLQCYIDKDSKHFVDKATDLDWKSKALVEISAPPGPSFWAASMDFGLSEAGTRTIKVRKAFISYIVDDMPDGYENPVTISKIV